MNRKKGAEADVEIKEEKVVKRRKSKKYRHEDLDEKIREKRTKKEKNLMEEARRHNLKIPKTEKKDTSVLEMERIEGNNLKDVIKSKTNVMKKLGESIAQLHNLDIIHGDLTTSNVILSSEKEVYLIDFGLSFRSKREEDKAVDIHLLKQVIRSSHPEVAEKAWESFLDGYREYEDSETVLEQLEEVEQRGRYK